MIERRIYLIRGHKVMLDSDLAALYQVPTKSLNLAVRRNAQRFPEDFMFQLTGKESESLRFQFETSKTGRGGRRYLPHAFTEHGVAMLSSVLRSSQAIQMNILVIRAFVRLREIISTHKDLTRKMQDLERKQQTQGAQIAAIYGIVKKLMAPPKSRRRPIGFVAPAEESKT